MSEPLDLATVRRELEDVGYCFDALNECGGICNPPPYTGEWCALCCLERITNRMRHTTHTLADELELARREIRDHAEWARQFAADPENGAMWHLTQKNTRLMAANERLRKVLNMNEISPMNLTIRGEQMIKYRKRPIVIEAFQMTLERRWDNTDWPEWLHQAWNTEGQGALFIDADDPAHERLVLGTLEGVYRISWDDWIIRGIAGELYPCKPDIFEATYEQFEGGRRMTQDEFLAALLAVPHVAPISRPPTECVYAEREREARAVEAMLTRHWELSVRSTQSKESAAVEARAAYLADRRGP
jgi:hypothetical protein